MRKKLLIRTGAAAALSLALTCSFCRPVEATIITTGTGILPSTTGGGAGSTLAADYTVDLTAGIYTYTYTLKNPGTDTTRPDQFSVTFDAFLGSSVLTTSGGLASGVNPGSSVTWFFLPVAPGGSVTLSFTSLRGWKLGAAGANDSNPPAPWSTQHAGGVQVAVPVPEPTTMLAGALLLVPFGASTLRVLRKRTT